MSKLILLHIALRTYFCFAKSGSMHRTLPKKNDLQNADHISSAAPSGRT